jgi:hypothetical protein
MNWHRYYCFDRSKAGLRRHCAGETARGFPANINNWAALALAGIDPNRTMSSRSAPELRA